MISGTEMIEGSTRIIVPNNHSISGPGKKTNDVFFNEQMAFNRDISVMFLRAFSKKMTIVDTMAATGSRSIRIANEVPETMVTANDINTHATLYIKENIRINNLDNCIVSNKNMHSLLAEEVFDYVDIDPFGSPIPFLHSSIIGCKRDGYLAITATDTAPLAGAHIKKCIRRYQSTPLRGPMCHEAGLRILIGAIAREAAKFNKGISSVLSFSSDHYFRVYLKIMEGAKHADTSLSNLIYVSYNPVTLERSFSSEPGEIFKYGPFWGGTLFDKKHLSKMNANNMATEKRCNKYLETWRQEIDVPLMYEISEISSYLKKSTPPFGKFIERMNEYGETSRTHISPTGFKTVLSLKEIFSVYTEVLGEIG